MKQFNNKKGFTLIELLVVIAIIGILSSIVLVSMGSARDKAKDAAIKADLDQIRKVAEMEYSENNSYAGLGENSDFLTLKADIESQNGTVTIATSTDAYCVESTLNSGTNQRRCVDSSGKVRDYAKATSDCDAATCDCDAD